MKPYCPGRVFRLRPPLFLLLLLFSAMVRSDTVPLWQKPWSDIVADARGQTVWFHAWGGSEPINRYIADAARLLKARYGIELEQVRVADIAESIAAIEASHRAGVAAGDIDLVWINGENFARLKRGGLLFGPFADVLPAAAALPPDGAWRTDFSEPVDGLESPWGQAQLVFIHDSDRLAEPPRSATELLEFVEAGGRFLYPPPPTFHGTTLLKQWLLELSETPELLQQPVDRVDFDTVSAPLWAYLDRLHPRLVGGGTRWPDSAAATLVALDNAEIDIAVSFNPNEAANAVHRGQLAESVRTSAWHNGTIGNTHYLSIPVNASAPAAAMVVANWFLDVEAQVKKADPAVWGDPSVLDPTRLDAEARAAFAAIDTAPWALEPGRVPILAEPHASWTDALERAWLQRYGQ